MKFLILEFELRHVARCFRNISIEAATILKSKLDLISDTWIRYEYVLFRVSKLFMVLSESMSTDYSRIENWRVLKARRAETYRSNSVAR